MEFKNLKKANELANQITELENQVTWIDEKRNGRTSPADTTFALRASNNTLRDTELLNEYLPGGFDKITDKYLENIKAGIDKLKDEFKKL